MSVEFLDLEDVLDLHANLVERFGGDAGIRDVGLLESALHQPRTTFDGDYLHVDLFEMAAAYLYHLVQGHAFVDGNKRVGLLAALVFLELNGVRLHAPSSALYELTMAVAADGMSKSDVAEELRRAVLARSTG